MNTSSRVSKVSTGEWSQEWYETGDPAIKARAQGLRGLNVVVRVSSWGVQVTPAGLVKMSLLDVRRNGVDECVWDTVVA